MKHNVFGEIEFTYMWTREYSLNLFGEKDQGILNIAGELDEVIDKIQEDAFIEFEKKKSELGSDIVKALFSYYNEVVEEYRDRYGDDADQYAPIISNRQELSTLLKFEAINLPYSFVEGERIVGVLFKSKWEVEHGVAVKLVNEKIVEVGYQDIVL